VDKAYKFSGEIQVPHGLPMVALLNGFSDSGQIVAQLSNHFFTELESSEIVRFDNDQFLDYRSRRPTLFFEKDHIESYEPPSLAIHLIYDEAHQPFLLLEGYEPDLKWESFAQSILEIMKLFEVSQFTWVHSIPFPIPHTRPAGVTVSGNRTDMIQRFSEWKPQTQVPGNVTHLLEYRLSKEGIATAGFVLLVPHYLADNEVPNAALTGLELLRAATGLVFPSDKMRDAAAEFAGKVNAQVADNSELAKLVQTLEQGYSSGTAGPSRAPIGRPSGEPPTIDELAEELENYLTTMRKASDDSE